MSGVWGRWGKFDRKSIVHVLDEGIQFLRDETKEQTQSREITIRDFDDLEKLLYNEGANLLSMTNQVRFEKRLNTVRKNLHKLV